MYCHTLVSIWPGFVWYHGTLNVPDMLYSNMCVYCSLWSGDLLVGVYKYKYKHTHSGNTTGRHTQIIPPNTENCLYRHLLFITNNNNGDILVYDSIHRVVVVTSGEGRHRFSYAGPDAVSTIRVCDPAVHMLSENGEWFLK